MSATRPTPETDQHQADMEREDFDVELAKTYTLARKLKRQRDELTNKMIANEAYQSGLLADIQTMRETMREAAGILAQIPAAYDSRFFRAGQWANAALAQLQPHLCP